MRLLRLSRRVRACLSAGLASSLACCVSEDVALSYSCAKSNLFRPPLRICSLRVVCWCSVEVSCEFGVGARGTGCVVDAGEVEAVEANVLSEGASGMHGPTRKKQLHARQAAGLIWTRDRRFGMASPLKRVTLHHEWREYRSWCLFSQPCSQRGVSMFTARHVWG